jgi:hypothetical protein
MKQGKSLVELATEIQKQNKAKRDFIAPTTKLEYLPEGERGAISLSANGHSIVTQPTRHCLQQVCSRVGIPMTYAERMVEGNGNGKALDLLATNINYWFQHKPETRMLRTMINGSATARAFLSDRYRPLDNVDLAEAVLPKLSEFDAEVVSSQITETRLYIQAATAGLEARIDQIRKAHGWTAGSHKFLDEPQVVRAGAIISNSEVGAGSISIEFMLYFMTCLNGLIMARSHRRYHVGRANEAFSELDAAAEYFSDSTRRLDDKAFFAKIQDVVAATFTREKFEALTLQVAKAGGVELDKPADAVVEVGKRFKLTEEEEGSVLDHLIKSGDNSLLGLVNAVTRSAEDNPSYDRAVELERMGGAIIELPQSEWKKL